jgi:hypothetical protein
MVIHPVGLLFSQPPPDGGCRSFSLPITSLLGYCTSLAPKGKIKIKGPQLGKALFIMPDGEGI